jgi:hypothetical protein
MEDQIVITPANMAMVHLNGEEKKLPLSELWQSISTTSSPILPHGTICCHEGVLGNIVFVHEQQPRIVNLQWAYEGFKADGEHYKYRRVKIALPYVIFIGSVAPHGTCGQIACYFRNKPVQSLQDKLCYPALPNVATSGEYDSYVCMSNKERVPAGTTPAGTFKNALRMFWEGSFNTSFELSRQQSWYTRYVAAEDEIYSDIAPVENWENMTAHDPNAVLSVPWVESKHTVAEVVNIMSTGPYGRALPAGSGLFDTHSAVLNRTIALFKRVSR